jgi:hypothetical protein
VATGSAERQQVGRPESDFPGRILDADPSIGNQAGGTLLLRGLVSREIEAVAARGGTDPELGLVVSEAPRSGFLRMDSHGQIIFQ